MFFLPALFLTALAILSVLLPLSRSHAFAGTDAAHARRRRLAALAALLFIPGFSLGVYWHLGHPNLPDMPLAKRQAANLDEADFSVLISRLEDSLQKNRDDVRGWMLLARSYHAAGRDDDSARAYREVLRLKKNDPEARYFLAKEKIGNGDKAGGIGDLKALLKESPKDAPWRDAVQKDIGKNE